MTKTYKIVTIETADIDIQRCIDVMMDALRDHLYDEYEIDYPKHEQIIPELMRDIAEYLKKPIDK